MSEIREEGDVLKREINEEERLERREGGSQVIRERNSGVEGNVRWSC